MNYSAAVKYATKKCKEFIAQGGGPGIGIGIVTRDEILLEKGYGFEDIEMRKPLTPETIILLASVSKTISGTLVNILQKSYPDKIILEAKLNVETSIDYVTKNLTVKDVITHRGGIPMQYGSYNETVGYSRKEIMNNLVNVPNTEFRNIEQYTNLPFTQGIEVAVEVVDLTLNLAFHRLFRKLNMSHSSINYQPGKYKGYIGLEKKNDNIITTNNWHPVFDYNVEEQVAAGGIYSNVKDMNNFVQFHLNQLEDIKNKKDTIIDPSFYRGVYTSPIYFIGTGINISYQQFNDTIYIEYAQSGAFLNVRTRILFFNDLNIGLFIAVNSSINTFPEALGQVLPKILLGMSFEDADIEFNQTYKLAYDVLAPNVCIPSFKVFGNIIDTISVHGKFNNNELGNVIIYKDARIKVGHLGSVNLLHKNGSFYMFLLYVKFKQPYLGKLKIINNNTIKLKFWCVSGIYTKQCGL